MILCKKEQDEALTRAQHMGGWERLCMISDVLFIYSWIMGLTVN